MALQHSPKIVTDDLTFLLDAANKKSYDQTGSGGTTWTDLSGNGNNGTLTNVGAIFHEIGSHFKFNELLTAGTGYVEMGDIVTTSYTKNIWFRTNAANNNNLMSGASADSTVFWCAGTERYIAAGHHNRYNPNSNAIVEYDSGSTTGLRTWHNACVTYSSAGTTMKLYVNGVLVDTGTEVAPIQLSLHIAGYSNQYELSGDVAYASLYSRALNAEEVLQNYNAIKNRFTFTSNAANTAPSYSATPASSSVNEGSSLTINVATTNVADSTTLYWTVTNTGDFGTSSGNFTINSNSGSFTVTPTADATTEGSETFTVSIRTISTSGNIEATSSNITINDTSTAPVATYSATPAANNVDEGSALTINVATTNVADATTLYWTVTNSGDFGTSSGSFTINSDAGSFTVTPTADTTTEGAETFQVQIRTDSVSGTIVDTSDSITINDTSTTPAFTPDYTITVTNSGNSYNLSGTDRNGAVSGSQPTLAFNSGDKVRFDVSGGNTATQHPFYIKTSQSTGTGNQVSGATGQGTTTVDWTTATDGPGSYGYQCSIHFSMWNTITIS